MQRNDQIKIIDQRHFYYNKVGRVASIHGRNICCKLDNGVEFWIFDSSVKLELEPELDYSIVNWLESARG